MGSAEFPVAVRDRRAVGDLAVDGLTQHGAHQGAGVAVHVGRKIRNRVAHHVERRRIQSAAVDDAAEHRAGDARQHRRHHVMVRERRCRCAGGSRHIGRQAGHARRHGGGAGVVALPAAQQVQVTRGEQIGVERHVAAAVGHVVPHQAARVGHVHRLADAKARDVLDVATRIAWRETEVGDFLVVAIARIQFAEGAAGQFLVGLGGVGGVGQRGGRVDDDARHARLRERARQRGAACENGDSKFVHGSVSLPST